MAGTNKVVKENEILFKFGDPAECMYIVRKGALKVYFTKGTEEIELAVLKDGAIVGEMAFFDQKPRSASVKAMGPTEVTEITKTDFDKLLQQVPKWVVTMMQSLVTRLRQTNERLQALEATQTSSPSATPGQGSAGAGGALLLPRQQHPFQHVLRALKLILMALSKDGQKEGTAYSLPYDSPKKLWADFSGEDLDLYERIVQVSEQTKFLQKKLDAQKSPILVFTNRGSFAHFLEFFGNLAKGFKPLKPFFSPDAMALINALVETGVSSGYETVNVSFTSVKATYAAKGANTAGWAQAMGELMVIPDMRIAKVGNDVTVRIIVKDHKITASYLKLIQLYADAKLL